MKIIKSVFTFSIVLLLISCLGFSKKEDVSKATYIPTKETKVAYFASGCFWCVEAIFESVAGVEEAVSGYAGGFTKNPTYESIGTGKTGHAEAVAVYFLIY